MLLDEGVNDGLVARFTADITCMDINNEKGDILVAGSADMTIKVVNTESYEVIATFEGHLAPILSVSIDSNGLYAASSSCDGTIRYILQLNTSYLYIMNNGPLLALCILVNNFLSHRFLQNLEYKRKKASPDDFGCVS